MLFMERMKSISASKQQHGNLLRNRYPSQRQGHLLPPHHCRRTHQDRQAHQDQGIV